MKIRPLGPTSIILAWIILTAASAAHADEGMWLFNNPPRKLLQEKYKFEPTKDWLEHVQKSCVRFNSGGSGPFVSADGLVLSNHHGGPGVVPPSSKPGGKDHAKE